MSSTRWIRIPAVFVTVGLFAVSCGSTAGEDRRSSSDTGESPAVASACAPDHPDCEDTVVVDDRGLTDDDSSRSDEDSPPLTPTGPVGSSGMAVDGGLTIPEALATEAQGILAIQGHLFNDGSGLRLCSDLAESPVPLCTEPSVAVSGLDPGDLSLSAAEGVKWTDDTVTLFGELIDGEFAVNDLVTG